MKKLFVLLLTVTPYILYGQSFSLSLRRASLETAFLKIQQQSRFRFVYTTEDISAARPVTIEARNVSLDSLLALCFFGQPLGFTLQDNFIVVRLLDKNQKPQTENPLYVFSGMITDQTGVPVTGASIQIENNSAVIISGSGGEFVFKSTVPTTHIEITCIGFVPQRMEVSANSPAIIRLSIQPNHLDETIVLGYGISTRRLTTASINKVRGSELVKHPISNPIAAMQGRVPGLVITQSNGLPGARFKTILRGRNSLQSGTSPLYIVNGVPYFSEGERLAQRSLLNAHDPFSLISSFDIASIEVLKDADATSVYGSRGANGVILITTHKPASVRNRFDIDVYKGYLRADYRLQLLGTNEYLAFRRDAFKNDGVVPTLSSAPDLLAWNQSRNVNMKDQLLDEPAQTINASLRYATSFGNFRVSSGAGYYQEEAVFPGNFYEQRHTANTTMDYRSSNKKFTGELVALVTHVDSRLPLSDITSSITLPPNTPSFYDAAGNFQWSENGGRFNNPIANALQHFKSKTQSIDLSYQAGFRMLPQLELMLRGGFRYLEFVEGTIIPIASQDPAFHPKGSAGFGRNMFRTWIVEPQATYHWQPHTNSQLECRLGATLQQNDNSASLTRGTGYTNDAMLNSIHGAANVSLTTTEVLYRYSGAFIRINYNHKQNYMLTLSGRRDGSSRFAPGKQFGLFGAIAGAWVFSSEKFMTKYRKLLDHGKLRITYGSSGNDQIGDYNYTERWAPTQLNLNGTTGLRLLRPANPEFGWEQINKLDIALEVGLFRNRLFVSINWYHSKSSNQLVFAPLPAQTGFHGIVKNIPAVIKNHGFEVSAETVLLNKKDWSWQTQLTVTIPRNKLLRFPALSLSPYASQFTEGHPVSSERGYFLTGVSPVTGLYEFKDWNGDGSITLEDQTVVGNTEPQLYGGLANEIRFKQWSLAVMFQYVSQKGLHPVYANAAFIGQQINGPASLTNRWRSPGDLKPFQRATQSMSSDARASALRASDSQAAFTDASFVRLKNLHLAFALPAEWLKRLSLTFLELSLRTQNILTLTSYKGPNPETQALQILPPLKVMAIGARLKF
jgi:TonB-dependent starch-binding outer membrane protein SusC